MDLKLLRELVEINSIFPNEKKIGEFLYNYLKGLGFDVKKQYVEKDRFNIIAEKKFNEKESVMFYGHMDTVPVYGKWDSDPFELKIDGDKAYGLGAWDMKGGIFSILKAIENIEKNIKVVFGVDEENISLGAHKLMETDVLDDVFGIVVAEAGNSEKNYENFITLGRRGRAVYKFKFYGKSAHGAFKSKGKNAIIKACKKAIELENMEMRKSKYFNGSQFVRRIFGESSSLSIPDYAELEIDRALIVPETVESVQEELKKYGNVELKERATPYMNPYITNENEKIVKIAVKAIEKVTKEKPKFNYGLSVADENVFAQKKPVITIGPKGENEHSANEWVSIKSLKKTIDIYKEILKKI